MALLGRHVDHDDRRARIDRHLTGLHRARPTRHIPDEAMESRLRAQLQLEPLRYCICACEWEDATHHSLCMVKNVSFSHHSETALSTHLLL